MPVSTRNTCVLSVSNPISLSSIIFSNSYLLELEVTVCNHVDNEREIAHNLWRDLLNVGTNPNNRELILQAGNSLPTDMFYSLRVLSIGIEDILNSVESLIILWYYLKRATTRGERLMAFTTYCKCVSKQALTTSVLLSDKFEQFFNLVTNNYDAEVQSLESMFDILRNYMNDFEMLKKLPLYTKLYKFFMYALSLSLFEKFGVTFDNLAYSQIEAEAIKRKYHTGLDFAYTVADTMLFLCERGYQCMKTGTLDPIYHSDGKYTAWYKQYETLKFQSNFLATPEIHNINVFSYVTDLNDCIEKGNAIAKYAQLLADFERKAIRSALNDLEYIKATFITKRAAQKARRAPFSPLILGGSSVAKSAMVNIIANHLTKVYGNSLEDGFMYTRNSTEKHWNGLTSSASVIVIDDIAFMNPNAAPGIDPTMVEVISVNNNMAFVPEQAELGDKGKIAVRPDIFISTTNTEHLNAHAYFACPLAIRRRFPWVIDIIPKEEYVIHDCMIDGSKIPPCVDGCYPDLWHITIKKVVPVNKERECARAKLVIHKVFENIDDFLAWLSVEALEHRAQQQKAMLSNDNNKHAKICHTCYRVETKCVCNLISPLNEELQSSNLLVACIASGPFATMWLYFVVLIMKYYVKKRFLTAIFDMFGGSYFMQFLLWLTPAATILAIGNAGGRIQRHIGVIQQLILFVGMIGTGGVLFHQLKKYFTVVDPGNVQAKVVIPESVSSNRGSAPEPSSEERNNVWYNDEYNLTSFDVSPASLSQIGVSDDEICTRLSRSCVQFIPRFEANGVPVTRPTKAINVAGHIYMCNNHGLPEIDSFDLEIIRTTSKDGINPNITITVTQGMIHRFPECDICFINVRSVPPGPNIIKYFAKATLSGNFNGWYISRGMNGSVNKLVVKNLNLFKKKTVPQLGAYIDTWSGYSSQPTIKGECGSMLLTNSKLGPIILGIHYLGMVETCEIGAIAITDELVNRGINSFNDLIVQSGPPMISAPSAIRTLGPLHNKSVFRYIPDGIANVYGSFSGFKVAPKTHVQPSLLIDSMLKRGFTLNYGPPVMTGWRPWRNAAIPLTHPTTKINQDILKRCVDAFTNEILSSLSKEELGKVKVYDNFTAINGASGISFVDKMKRTTSMGCPWKRNKKWFTYSIPEQRGLPDAVDFVPEIMDRVDKIIENYESGTRNMPVFCANLKDEAKKLKHIAIAKTRAFMGGPTDWCIVVRKYLLSIIRLIQNNRFIFESGPGTNAQSTEWGKLRTLLTKFGLDSLIAGDYANFDKEMASLMILAAFDIILAICKAAGYSDEELLVVKGIAEDTAFPLMDFNGDLIETFGGNPSGHPLTVIINGLVNCLYMRYCFVILGCYEKELRKKAASGDPQFYGLAGDADKDYNYAQVTPSGGVRVENFKSYVSLFTYGDDNAMGVSKDIPWFNHTTISKTLADLGITYTMADKEAVSVPYIHIDEVSFLKRAWRFDKDVGAYLAPLEEDSIIKSLMINVESKSITREKQAIYIMASAMREYFFYGKSIYDEKQKMFREFVEENDLQHYVEESTFQTWHELRFQFWNNSKGLAPDDDSDED